MLSVKENTMLHALLIGGVVACVLGVKVLYRENGTTFRMRYAYLLRKRKAAYDAFEKLTSGYEGLCVCRAPPNGKTYQNTLILDENGISSHDLEKLLHFINGFVKPGNRVVLLDCLDYFIEENDFEEAVRFLHSLKDQIALNQSILLATLDLGKYHKREQSFIKREMDRIM
ncbi:MAG: DUF835 domain-containing protein [Theionarchaea archaeon]|nr:DUF835 domain-containing protein [Theionarchaea archaeon]MBU7000023.1 DUF835 domain-containing protein [Theionarchaea archaeon]MBU7021679.1 DUF835 domain-containing protein [Theionarchaea archaeon]MBU7035019.1 DUF835 domain-containing protein [Theionarchaea archaeon]